MSYEDLFKWCLSCGFLRDHRGIQCPECREGKYKLRESPALGYVCDVRSCRHAESVTERERGFFLPRVPLDKQILVLYRMVYNWQPAAAEIAADADMDRHGVSALVRLAHCIVTWHMLRANAMLQIGGVDEDCEIDELSFRCMHQEEDGKIMKIWLRFLGAVRRGSSLYYWGELDDRKTEGARGGGGPIDKGEVELHVLNRTGSGTSRPLFASWSIVHSDTAKSYDILHREKGDPKYKHLRLWHTRVRHSRKKGPNGHMLPVQFCVRKKVKLRSGATSLRKGGTQKQDGFWAIVRKHVARRSVRNVRRDEVRHMSYFFQWLYWRSERPLDDAKRGRREKAPSLDLLGSLGGLYRQVRETLGQQFFDECGEQWFDKVKADADLDLPLPAKRVSRKSHPV